VVKGSRSQGILALCIEKTAGELMPYIKEEP